jgi:DNA-binding MarR family transcriptional regulator
MLAHGFSRAHSLPVSAHMTRPADIYLRFLQLTDALRGLPSLPSLDPLEERILALVARASQARERLSVRDMMAKSELGSPAMLHARLKSMREKGWISLADTEDARRKQIELTQAALRHFDKLSECLVKAAKNG